ncbi:MAG: XcyI family restriction endonuclease, partial [Rubrobacteraceae bacterium]
DPFLGSGTVAEVAIQNRRAFIGIELNPEYVEIARQRISRLGGGWINGWKKLTDLRFAPIPSDKPIDLYEALISARRLQLQPALGRAVSGVGATTIDEEFRRLVPADALDHVASLGLRGERVFPVPSILEHAPPLIGYYRMLLGISKKDFGDANKLGYGPWKNTEESGVISARILPDLPRFCEAFIKPLADLVFAMDVFDDRDLSDLTLLTLGPTLQGARNNVIGRVASKKVFAAIRTLVSRYATFDSKRLVRFETPAGRSFALVEGTDPDVRLDATVSGGEMPIIAIEIKGGEDASNAHNRAGEAEKSHLKARQQGFDHRWTIMVMRGLDRQRLSEETPSSTRLFEATNVMSQTGADWDSLRRGFLEIIGESS